MCYPKAILFDFGNTLVTGDGYDLSAACDCLSGLLWPTGGSQDRQRLEQALLTLDAEAVRLRSGTTLEFSSRSLLRLLLAHLGIDSSVPLEKLEAAYYQGLYRYRPVPGAGHALANLHARGIRLGVVSNCMFTADLLIADLERMGFLSYLDLVISSADYGLRKQHPLLFSAALSLMKLTAAEAWFVGDSLEYDIGPARSVGMRAVWYNPKGVTAEGTQPDAVIGAWAELPALLPSALG